MKRKSATILLATILTLSLTACGSQKPSLKEVEQAIQEGNLTLEDALDKGYITQEWADEYISSRSVLAVSKIDAGAIGDFTSATLSGEEFHKDQMSKVTLFAFLDPSDPDSSAFYQTLVDGYEGVKENGAEILVCTKSDEGNDMFLKAPFPVISYNDSLKAATEKYREMIEGMPNTASWCVNGSFYSAWYSTMEAEDLADLAASFLNAEKEITNGSENNSGELAVMG